MLNMLKTFEVRALWNFVIYNPSYSICRCTGACVVVSMSLLQGQYKSTVICQKCEKKSVVFEPFVCLPLEIPSPTRCSLAVSAPSRQIASCIYLAVLVICVQHVCVSECIG